VRLRVLFGLSLLLGPSACAKCGGGGDSGLSTAEGGPSAAVADCVEVGRAQRFGVSAGGVAGGGEAGEATGPVPFAAELGGATMDGGAWLIGVRAPGPLGEGKLLRLSADGGDLHTLASWLPSKGVARAPKPFAGVSGGAGGAAGGGAPIAILTGAAGDRRTVAIARLRDGKLESLTTLPEEEDESEAITAMATREGALVAWDDVGGSGSGYVRVRAVSGTAAAPAATSAAPAGSGSAAPAGSGSVANRAAPAGSASAAAKAERTYAPPPADAISPATSDASFPVLVPLDEAGTRAALFWLAERPDATEAPDGGAGEPSQDQAYRWIEGVVLDVARGRAIGPVVSLTAKDGHAQTFSAQLDGGTIYLAIRDDARPTDGDGGSVYVVATAPPPSSDAAGSLGAPRVLARVDKDVSAGLPTIAIEARPWLFWLGPDDTARLALATAPVTTPIAEPALDGVRLVAQSKGTWLTSRLVGAGLELSLRRCSPR
jgi:hypothetical protein